MGILIGLGFIYITSYIISQLAMNLKLSKAYVSVIAREAPMAIGGSGFYYPKKGSTS
jgi:hypothetical protein